GLWDVQPMCGRLRLSLFRTLAARRSRPHLELVRIERGQLGYEAPGITHTEARDETKSSELSR
ncbi:MAG: hypothetical protein ACJ74E_01420, partial [Actinomycetes bacterium]